MYHFLRETFRLLRRDERGNVFILFGATAIPLLLIMGGAVDFARYTRYKTALSNAVDAASLALARQGEDFTEDQAKTFVTNRVTSYINSFYAGDSRFSVQSFDVDKLDNGFQVTANGSMQTIFLPLGRLAKNGHRHQLDGGQRHRQGGERLEPARAGTGVRQHRLDELRRDDHRHVRRATGAIPAPAAECTA